MVPRKPFSTARVSLAKFARKTERKRKELGLPKRLILAILVLASYSPYHWLNDRAGLPSVLRTSLEDSIPFLPIFSVPYVLFYPLVFATVVHAVFFSKSHVRTSAALVLCYSVASFLYFAFQTTVPRPTVVPQDVFSQLVVWVYAMDKPYNCFPSLHVAISISAYVHWRRHLGGAHWIVAGLVLGVVSSTLFIKQHCISDVVGGVALATIGWYFGKRCEAYCSKVHGIDTGLDSVLRMSLASGPADSLHRIAIASHPAGPR